MIPLTVFITLLVIIIVVGILAFLSFLIFGGTFFQAQEAEQDYNNSEKRY